MTPPSPTPLDRDIERLIANPKSHVYRDDEPPHGLFVGLNDFFYAAADAEEVPDAERGAVLAAWDRAGWHGILHWVIHRRYVSVAAPCPYIRASDEGTHFCALAAAPSPEPPPVPFWDDVEPRRWLAHYICAELPAPCDDTCLRIADRLLAEGVTHGAASPEPHPTPEGPYHVKRTDRTGFQWGVMRESEVTWTALCASEADAGTVRDALNAVATPPAGAAPE